MAGARPGPSLQVRFTGVEHLELTIRNAARRVSLAIAAGACIVAAGFTADRGAVGDWVPITLGVVGGLLVFGLLLDIVFHRH